MKHDMPILTNMMENAVIVGMLFSGCGGFAVVSVSIVYYGSSSNDEMKGRRRRKERASI